MASTIRRRAPAYFTRSGGVDRRFFERVRRFIETRADAERNRTRNLRSLRSAGNLPRLLGRMLRCDDGAPCEELLCSRCARRYPLKPRHVAELAPRVPANPNPAMGRPARDGELLRFAAVAR